MNMYEGLQLYFPGLTSQLSKSNTNVYFYISSQN